MHLLLPIEANGRHALPPFLHVWKAFAVAK